MPFKVFFCARTFLPTSLILLFPAVLCASDRADWQERMQPITPRSYLCRRAVSPIIVDGKLDEGAWSVAQWTEDFVDIEGPAKPKPLWRTRAKMLWDDDYRGVHRSSRQNRALL